MSRPRIQAMRHCFLTVAVALPAFVMIG